MKSKTLLVAASVAGIFTLIYACKAKKVIAAECVGVNLTYAKDVKPILDANCAGCHSGTKPADGIDLSSYEGVKKISAESRFLGAIRHLAGFDAMPLKASKMSDSTIRVISCWVQNGTPE